MNAIQHTSSLGVLTLSAASLMVYAGVAKRRLVWKARRRPPRRGAPRSWTLRRR
jgi:hypothetical protein